MSVRYLDSGLRQNNTLYFFRAYPKQSVTRWRNGNALCSTSHYARSGVGVV